MTGRLNRVVLWAMLAGFVLVGMAQVGQGAYIHVKAQLAQVLLNRAWAASLDDGDAHKAWSWADTWPTARLVVPGHGIDMVVLEGASGEALAFGPGRAVDYALPGQTGTTLIAGHKDTHFRFLQDLRTGDRLWLEGTDGGAREYAVVETTILDSRTTTVNPGGEGSTLVLLTCYPFDPLVVGGPLRYLVFAEPTMST